MVEDKILEYLDGSLGDRESAELLETLSVSPEKRAILEEHLRMKDLLALGRKPFTVPLETERSLAERIPILGKYEDEVAPFIARFSVVRNWMGARSIRIATGVAILLALAGFGWYSLNGTAAKNIVPTGLRSSAISSLTQNVTNIPEETPHHVDDELATNSSSVVAIHRSFHSQGSAKSLVRDESEFPIASAQPSYEEPKDIQAVNPIIPSKATAMVVPDGHFAHTLSELLLPSAVNVSHYSIGGSMILNQSYLPTLSTGSSHSLIVPMGDITFDYDLSPTISAGIEAGSAEGPVLTNSASYVGSPSSNYTRLLENSIITNQTLYDVLATVHITLFPESEYQLRFGAAGGDAFGAGPIVQGSIGISRVLATNLILDVTAVANRLWTSGNPVVLTPSPSSEVVGVVGQQTAVKSMYANAVGISAGIRIRLPE